METSEERSTAAPRTGKIIAQSHVSFLESPLAGSQCFSTSHPRQNSEKQHDAEVTAAAPAKTSTSQATAENVPQANDNT